MPNPSNGQPRLGRLRFPQAQRFPRRPHHALVVSAVTGRHASFPPAATPPVQPLAPAPHQSAPSLAPSSVPASSPAIGRAIYASALSSFPASSDDDDLSIGYDFVDSDSNPNPTSDATTSYYDLASWTKNNVLSLSYINHPYSGFLLTWILHPLLFLICAYSTCHQSLNSNTPLLQTCHMVGQAVQSYVFSTSSMRVGTALMAHPPVSSSHGHILCTLQPPATHVCISGASSDMCLIKEFFEDCVPFTDHSHITVANRCRIKVAGSGTLRIILGSISIAQRLEEPC